MTRKILAVLLNLITLIGGHFINRRWDRAVFILGLLLLSCAASFAYLSVSFEQVTDTDDVIERSQQAWQIFMYIVASVWALSLILTFYDIRQYSDRVIGGVTGNIGAVILSTSTFLIALLITWTVLALNGPVHLSGSEKANRAYFHEYMTFGIISGFMDDYGEPPLGEAAITGLVTYKGQPVEGVSFRLGLNDKYRTKKMFSAKDGRFSVQVSAGEWNINRVEIDGWRDRPEGDFMVLSGHEPMLTGSDYSEYSELYRRGLPVAAEVDSKDAALEFVIRSKVSLVWPPKSAYSDRDNTHNEASLQANSIEWQPYEGAAQYVVNISRMEKDGEFHSFHSMGDYLVTGASLPMTKLMSGKSTGENKEYSIEVYAFDASGVLLSKSDTKHGDATFVLTDGNEIVKKPTESERQSGLHKERMKGFFDNRKRLDAIEILIDEDLLDEAERLMAKVTGPDLNVKKETLQGYLAAKRGNCELAHTLFERARNKEGKSCVPVRYQALCSGATE